MDLSIAQQFVIVKARQKSAYQICTQSSFMGIRLIGAAFFDLIYDGSLKLDGQRVLLNRLHTNLGPMHQMLLDTIASSTKPKKLKSWINRFFNRGTKKYRRALMDEMVTDGLLIKTYRKFLFIPYVTYRLSNPEVYQQTDQRLFEAIRNIEHGLVDPKLAAVLPLLKDDKVFKRHFQDYRERKQFFENLETIAGESTITREINRAIKEMEAAIMVTTMASVSAG